MNSIMEPVDENLVAGHKDHEEDSKACHYLKFTFPLLLFGMALKSGHKFNFLDEGASRWGRFDIQKGPEKEQNIIMLTFPSSCCCFQDAVGKFWNKKEAFRS